MFILALPYKNSIVVLITASYKKSPRSRGIKNELFRNLSPDYRITIKDFLNTILCEETTPLSWSGLLVCMLHKKGGTKNQNSCHMKKFARKNLGHLIPWALVIQNSLKTADPVGMHVRCTVRLRVEGVCILTMGNLSIFNAIARY